jgi:hypothetical protein
MKAIRLLLTLLPLSAAASVLSTLPYGMPSPYGVFAMASAGARTGNSISAVGPNNFGVLAASGQIVTNTGLTPQTANASYATTTNNTASSFASATPGIIRISSQFSNGDAVPAITTEAYADAGWFDTLTISNAALDGTPGQVTFTFHAEGTLFGGFPNGSARINYAVATKTSAPELFVNVSGGADTTPGSTYSETVLQNHSVTIDFVWGASFEVLFRAVDRVGLRSVFGGLPAGSTSSVDFSSTFYYAGLQSVMADGSPISTYSFTSASGFDYTQAQTPPASVPEPATVGLCAACLAIIAADKWRTR